ncbi:thymidine kinase [Alphaentomopoxvirus acuprea]|uniref:Thymidine kinase n=1 Tax=Alphaentomopoxvirus acuprea TaxID=62099 RepID=W6JL51_9POXV|nr:thymidine kinase [Anomala cuprea entomopoxvirus]BAO49570.1 thymidine kinase [Anomala cuprea entomopoxvirus]
MIGKIELIIGPMFSGKTTELIRKLNIYNDTYKCVAIKSKYDNRYSKDRIINHNNVELNRNIPVITSYTLSSCTLDNYDVIGIDEGQFFDDISYACDKLANNNKLVIVSALNSSYKREPFENISKLMSLIDIDSLCALSGICKYCSNKSIFTKRLNDDNKLIVVGSDDLYVPVCRTHYHI